MRTLDQPPKSPEVMIGGVPYRSDVQIKEKILKIMTEINELRFAVKFRPPEELVKEAVNYFEKKGVEAAGVAQFSIKDRTLKIEWYPSPLTHNLIIFQSDSQKEDILPKMEPGDI